MLVTFQVPLCDSRSFFNNHLGLIEGLDRREVSAAGNGTHTNLFLRSIGMPKRRLLGPGDSNLNECVFFDLTKTFDFFYPKPNRPMRSLVNYKSTRIRYYLFDEVVGRIDVSIPVSTKNSRNGLARSPQEIFRSAGNTEISISKNFMNERSFVGKFGGLASKVIQSRTTKEKHQGSDLASLCSILPGEQIVFIEAKASELIVDRTIQEIPVELDGLRLFHWYARANVRSWIILRNDSGRESYQNARILRMYLSRIYCHQAAFRTNCRKLPKLASNVAKLGNDTLCIDEYTGFLIENRRNLGRLSKGVSNATGAELGPMARLALDMISGNDTSDILREHELLISRKNVINSLREELTNEAIAESKISLPHENKTTNIILNIFGRQRAKQSTKIEATKSPIGLAKPIIRKLALSELVVSFAELFVVYGSQISKNRQDSIAKQIEQMQKICRISDVPGPTLLNLVEELRSNVDTLPHGSDQMCAKLAEIEQEILI